MAKVSVVTPSYNHARFLPDRVAFILSQTLDDFEWIIVDDSSNDCSRQILEKAAASDSRVKLYFNHRNLGMARTTQSAIARSSGRCVYRAESDDVCQTTFIERMVAVLEAHPSVGFAYCRALHMDEFGGVWGDLREPRSDFVRSGTDVFRTLVLGNFVPGPNIVFTREAHDRVGGFAKGPFQVACDWHFWLRLCLHYDVAYVGDALGYHRTHSGSLSGRLGKAIDLDLLFRESYELLMDVFESVPVESNDLRALRALALRRVSLAHAAPLFAKALLAGKWRTAHAIIDGVRRYDPEATAEPSWLWHSMRGYVLNAAYRSLYEPVARTFSGLRLPKQAKSSGGWPFGTAG